MPEKNINNIDIDKVLAQHLAPSIFDQLVKEVDADELPAEYIERIVVHYNNDTVVELSGEEINCPVPVNKGGCKENIDEHYDKMREVKVFIDTRKLERDVNKLLNDVFGNRC